jgi:Holliday junction DNA helicase RuvA
LRRAVVDDDLDALCMVPGIGKRTAQKLMMELSARLDVPDVDIRDTGTAVAPARAEVRAALTELGYDADEIRAVVADLPADGAVEDLLRDALRRLAVKA